MEIILKQSDIEQIIKKYYSGVTEIKFSSKNPKVTLVMTELIPIEQKSVTQHNITPISVQSPPKEDNRPKNIMTQERRIVDL